MEYTGGRDAATIIAWLKKKTGPPALTLTTAEEASKFKESAEVVVLGYFSDLESKDAKTFLEVASENDDYPFAIASDKSVLSDLNVDKDGVVLFKKFDEGRNDFEGELTPEALKKFITSNSLPLVVEFTHQVNH